MSFEADGEKLLVGFDEPHYSPWHQVVFKLLQCILQVAQVVDFG